MKGIYCIVFIILLLALPVFAGTSYEIDIQEKSITGKVVLELNSDQKVNRFSGNLILPEGSKLLTLKDSKDAIKEYSITGNVVDFTTNPSIAKDKEVVEATFDLTNSVKTELNNLKILNLSLSALVGEETVLILKNTGKFYSVETSNGFDIDFKEKEIQIKGENALNFTVSYSFVNPASESTHFAVFSESKFANELLKSEKYFFLLERITGYALPYDKIPVVVLNESDYSSLVEGESEGTYRNAIIILDEKQFRETPDELLLHESMHAFNAQIMRFNNSSTPWFDEGLSKIVEQMVIEKEDIVSGNLFYPEKRIPRQGSVLLVYPRATEDELLAYYNEGTDSVLRWNPGAGNNEFNYALAELILKDLINRNDWQHLKKGLQEINEISENVTTEQEFNDKLFSVLLLHKRPCEAENIALMRTCLEEINTVKLGFPKEGNLKKINSLTEEVILSKIEGNLEKQEFQGSFNSFESKTKEALEKLLNDLEIILERIKDESITSG